MIVAFGVENEYQRQIYISHTKTDIMVQQSKSIRSRHTQIHTHTLLYQLRGTRIPIINWLERITCSYLEARLLFTRTIDTLQKLYKAQAETAFAALLDFSFELTFSEGGASTIFCISGSFSLFDIFTIYLFLFIILKCIVKQSGCSFFLPINDRRRTLVCCWLLLSSLKPESRIQDALWVLCPFATVKSEHSFQISRHSVYFRQNKKNKEGRGKRRIDSLS